MKRLLVVLLVPAVPAAALATEAQAQSIDRGDTAWMLASTALVMLMTPGLALFYGGMVRAKNVLSTFMHSLFALAIVTLEWALIGYSLAFGKDHGGLIGGLDFALLRGVGLEARGTIPHLLFMMYQGMFAIITPALISGAFAERLKFSAYALFTLLWALLVYNPVAHWVWAEGGWLYAMGALDFAGGTVVHLISGASALVFALVLGRRVGHGRDQLTPHNLPLTCLGAGILCFGWFGFNGGSALASGGLAALALVNSQLAAGAAAFSWATAEWLRVGKPTTLGVASGIVAGLVAITPAAGFVGPMAAIGIGLAGGVVCYGGVLIKGRLRYDDSLDAFGVHGIGGALGALLTGVFAAKVWNPAGQDGLFAGNARLLLTQLVAVGAAAAYAVAATYGILKLVDKLVGLRVSEETEREGLDVNLHGEEAYALASSSSWGGHAVGDGAAASARRSTRLSTQGFEP